MSKFDKIFEARGGSPATEGEENSKKVKQQASKPKNSGKTSKDGSKPGKANNDLALHLGGEIHKNGSQQQTVRRRGRPQAKRSDPDYVGFTTYIRKDTHLNVKISLLQEGKGRELSELVESLLSDWMDMRRK